MPAIGGKVQNAKTLNNLLSRHHVYVFIASIHSASGLLSHPKLLDGRLLMITLHMINEALNMQCYLHILAQNTRSEVRNGKLWGMLLWENNQ